MEHILHFFSFLFLNFEINKVHTLDNYPASCVCVCVRARTHVKIHKQTMEGDNYGRVMGSVTIS